MKKRSSLRFFLIFTSILALASADFQDLYTYIYSVSTDPNEVSDTLKYVSMEGGSLLYIKGAGFSTRSALSNKVSVDDIDCPVIEFLTTSTQVVCQIPPSNIEKKASVKVVVDDIRIGYCYSCWVQYSYLNTPLFISMLPNAANPGDEVNFYGKPRVLTSADFDYIKIGDNRCDATEQNELDPIAFDPFANVQSPCRVSDLEAGHYNVSAKGIKGAGFARKLNTLPVYRFDGTAYDFTVVPKIDSISNNKGSSEGQIITIKGSGFSSTGQNQVQLADTSCKVLQQSSSEIVCELQARNTPIPERAYHAGLKFEKYNSKDLASVTAGTVGAPTLKASRLVFEIPLNSDDMYSSKMSGYFKAPVTGDYKFVVSADQKATFSISEVPLDRSQLKKIVDVPEATGYKFFFKSSAMSQISNGVSLTAGNYYYVELIHQEYTTEDYATVGVLIPNIPNTVNNPPEVQSVKINCPADPEVLEFRLNNVNGGQWRIRVDYLSSDGKKIDNTLYTSYMPYNALPSVISTQFGNLKLETTATRRMLKADGTVTEDISLAKTIIYSVTFLSLRTNGLLPVIDSSQLTGTSVSVKVAQMSSPTKPVAGTFTLKKDGITADLKYNAATYDFEAALRKVGFRDPIRVSFTGDANLGGEWRIQFSGDTGVTIQPLVFTSALTGCKTSPSITVTTLQESNQQDLFYEVIPIDMLFTAEDKPQVTVKSNGVTANCPKFNCDYTIQDTNLPQVVSSSYTVPTLSVSINGVNAGDYTKDKLKVFLGNTECNVLTYSDSSSPATLTANCPTPEAGDFHPKVHFEGLGFAKVNSAVAKITINPVVFTVSPNQVNPNGGSVLTISGKGFSASLEAAQERSLEVKIGSTPCVLNSVTPTQIQCTTTPVSNAGSLAVTLNGKTAVSGSLSLLATPPTISLVSPSTVNPVLQTDITITGNNFESNTANTKVLLSNTQNSKVTECLTISSSSNQIKCKLLGASTGTYNLYVKTSIGYSNSIPFEVKIVVTSVSPSSGSNAGGTILTIQGGSFSSDKQQTLVFIGKENVQCDVISSTPTQVQCKTRAKDPSYGANPQGVVVATRIVEESLCDNGGSCTFTYSDSLTPEVSSLSATSVTPGDTLQISGTGFDSNPSGSLPVVTIGGQACTVTSNSDTQITISIPSNVVPNKAAVVAINVVGKGNASFGTNSNKIEVAPVISSISPSTGSTGGFLLTLSGTGFQSGASVKVGGSACEIRSLTPTSIVCKATTGGVVSLSYKDFTDLKCNATCFVSLGSAQTPTVTSVSPLNAPVATSFTLTIQGTKFNLGAVAVKLISKTDKTIMFTGLVTSSTATQISASFTNVAGGSYALEVTSGANIATSTATVTVPVTTSVSSPIITSLAGGNVITITGSGFFDNAQKEKNKVSVCGLPCKVTHSTVSSIQCEAPLFVNAAVKSTYSNVIVASKLQPAATWSDTGKESSVFDMSFSSNYTSTQTNCQIGIDIGEGLIAELKEVKFYPNPAIVGTILKDSVIEGSNDNTNYVLVATIDESAHDGWNTISIDNSVSPVRYRYYRLRGATSTAKCALSELQFVGTVLSDVTTTDLNAIDCKAKVKVNDQSQETASTAVSYRQSKTAVLTSIEPKMGTTAGGTTLTLTGTNFITTLSQIKVYIDDVECAVQSATTTQITCVTGPAPAISNRRSSLNSEIKIQFQDQGNVISNNIKYFYIDKWSDLNTWGGVTPPREGESVSIPTGQTVLLDVSPPKLKAIIIEGALIFDDIPIDLHCDYILVRNGRFQIGTWENPIQSKISITLYGTKESPQLPKFGNKVIGLMEGILDIHGKPRSHTWTVLDTTAAQGATSIVVQGVVDWAVGEEIVIASTDFDHYESESRRITAVSKNSPSAGVTTLTFAEPLKFRHYAGIQTFDGQTFEMRAEVGLLTRNILIKGDDMSPQLKYGVHILCHATSGDDSAVARISYIEVTKSGQAYQMGRYSIHFHLIGSVRESFVYGNSIHHTYNRAITVHGVHYLKLQKNVAYWCMGHTIFIEDGIETHNLFEDNLVINTISSMALLNTDQTPASFWITNPNNIWRRNRAAGSDRYGFWFDLREHPEGPSATNTVCPRGEKLGEFIDNEAHSCGRYGLRIHHEMIPRKYPCQDYSNAVANPPIPAEFKNFLGWKNIRSAIIGERLGAIKFKNIKAADNRRCGIEISDAEYSPPDTLLVEDAWIVGYTPENGGDVDLYIDNKVRGLITPRKDFFLARNVHFTNFDTNMTAIETCSHCESPSSSDAGGRSAFFEGLTFNNVKQRVRFNTPYKEILVDKDGSLTDNFGGGKGVVTFFNDHLNVPGCVRNEAVYNGLVCDETITIRRIEFAEVKPYANFEMQSLMILRMENNPEEKYGVVKYRGKSWAATFVLGYPYKLSWASRGDFSELAAYPSKVIRPGDKTIPIIFNHSEYRETFDIFQTSAYNKMITNLTTLWDQTTVDTVNSGRWYHDVTKQYLYIAFNAKDKQNLLVQSVKCRLNCAVPASSVPKESAIRLWSNATQWPNQTVPKDGDEVEIPGDWVIKLDVSTAKLKYLHVVGDLYFDSTKDDLVLTAENIWVEGQLFIGTNETNRYTKNAKILLTGVRNTEGLVIGQVQDVSNKVLAVTGNVTMYGQKVNYVYVRLQAPARINDTTIKVSAEVDWKVGDDILISPTQMTHNEYETRTIQAINNGTITLDKPLSHYHFGATTPTKQTPFGTLDMRAEVGLLSRNIKIEGTNEDMWGGRVYVGEIWDSVSERYLRGRIDFDGVEMKNLAQANTSLAGLTFERLATLNNLPSTVRRSVMRNSQGYQMTIVSSNGVTIEDNIFFLGYKFQIWLQGDSSNIKFRNNLVVGDEDRGLLADQGDLAMDFAASFLANVDLTDSEISGNIIAGCYKNCMITKGGDCRNQEEGPYFVSNNVAHSGEMGWVVKDPNPDCNGISHFTAYKLQQGVNTFFPTTNIKASHLIVSDTEIGLGINTGGELFIARTSIKNSYIAGVTPTGDPESHAEKQECSNIAGMYLSVSISVAKTIPPKKAYLPWYKIKGEHLWQDFSTIENVTFENFADNIVPGCKYNFAIKSNPYASDHSATTKMSNITLKSVGENNRIYFNKAQNGWIGIDDCGGWLCTGIKNIIVRDLDGTFVGEPASVMPANPGVFDANTCKMSLNENAYICKTKGWGLLTFESLDVDTRTRLISPVTVTSGETFKNLLNSYMDHFCEGFYTSLKRLSRFHSLVQDQGEYNVEFSGTVPNSLRWALQGALPQESVIVQYGYTKPQSVRVTNQDGTIIKPTVIKKEGDKVINPTDPCGTNLFSLETRKITIKLTGDENCRLEVTITNSIRASIRYELTMNDFFAQNGLTTFIDNVAAILNINPASIRVVQIRSGSTIIDFFLESSHQEGTDMSNGLASKELEDWKTKLTEAVKDSRLEILNSRILDSSFEVNLANEGENGSGSGSGSGSNGSSTPEVISSGSNLVIIIISVVVAVLAILVGAYFGYMKYKRRHIISMHPQTLKISRAKVVPAPITVAAPEPTPSLSQSQKHLMAPSERHMQSPGMQASTLNHLYS